MMTDILSSYQRDLNGYLKKLTTDLAQVLVVAAKAVEEFNAATAARGVAFEAEMSERMRHFREGPREEPLPTDGADPLAKRSKYSKPGGCYLDGGAVSIDPAAIEEFEANLKGPAMPSVYDTAGAP
jgi:hypothetical protein